MDRRHECGCGGCGKHKPADTKKLNWLVKDGKTTREATDTEQATMRLAKIYAGRMGAMSLSPEDRDCLVAASAACPAPSVSDIEKAEFVILRSLLEMEQLRELKAKISYEINSVTDADSLISSNLKVFQEIRESLEGALKHTLFTGRKADRS